MTKEGMSTWPGSTGHGRSPFSKGWRVSVGWQRGGHSRPISSHPLGAHKAPPALYRPRGTLHNVRQGHLDESPAPQE